MSEISINIDPNGIPYVSSLPLGDAPGEQETSKKRSGKGESLFQFPSTYTVIDIETTGFDPEVCDIIEVAAIKYVDGKQTEEFSSFVRPVFPVDSFITSLTGITNDMLKDAPDPSVALRAFCDFIGSDLLMGYNVSFDINFLYDNIQLYLSETFSNPFVDVLRLARRAFPEQRRHGLAVMSDMFHIPVDNAHRALADCRTCNAVYEKIREKVLENGVSLDDFVQEFISRRHHRRTLKAHEISVSETAAFNEFHPLYGKTCVFTGTLEKMPRRSAMQLVVNIGGLVGDSVTKKTNYLILGNNDFCSTIKGGKSSKQKKAEALILQGADLQIISENVFYDMILGE